MDFEVKNGVIYCEKGIPQPPRWFADSRLYFQFDESGITQIDYRNPAQGFLRGNNTVFVKRVRDAFRYFIEKDGVTYKPEYSNSRLWPFGIESEWKHNEELYKHRIIAVDEVVLLQIVTPARVASSVRLKLEFWEASMLIGSEYNDYNYWDRGLMREWKKWEYDDGDNSLYGGFTERPKENLCGPGSTSLSNNPEIEPEHCKHDNKLSVSITADFTLEHMLKAARQPINARHIFTSGTLEPERVYSFMIIFAPEEDALKEKCRQIKSNLEDRVNKQFGRYKQIADTSPVLESPYKSLNDFFSLIPMYHDSLKITDFPGAIRAKTTHYGVWGWDGITASNATAYWGDTEHIKNMLRFYEHTAHPELGIGHSFNNDMTVGSISAIPAQGMYNVLLQLYYNASGDIDEIKARYPFAKKIFQMIAGKEVAGTGFCEGSSLYPDYPDRMKETGHDISSFNNIIFYCAARSMNYLASLVGDTDFSRQTEEIFVKMEKNFVKLFFDPEKKFIITSIDSRTMEKRYCYDIAAAKWENSYCEELFEPISRDTLKFIEENAISDAGLREIPLWDDGYDGDGNQMHCWWPVNTECFIRLANEFDKSGLIHKWIGWISHWTEKLMCPEGISYYVETDDPETDRWHTLPGTWHGYSMRGWYQAAVHGIVGVGADAGGLTLYPYNGKEMILKGLHYKNKTFDIEMIGSGRYIECITVNGKRISGTNKIPSDLYKGEVCVDVKVKRTNKNNHAVYIKHANGIELTDYSYNDGKIKVKMSGAGTCRIKMAAERELQLVVDKESVAAKYDQILKIVTAEIKLKPGMVKELEIGEFRK